MANRSAATDAELNAALQASASGDTIELTASRDYLVSVAGIDCRPLGVTVRNAATVDARIKTGATSGEGFRDCFGLNFDRVRMSSAKVWGGGNVHIVDSPKANGLYFQGDHLGSSLTGSYLTGSGFGITLDGRRPNRPNGWVDDFAIDNCTFEKMGVDPIRAFGLRHSLITNNQMTDVSSYRYSGDQTSNRLHSDAMDLTQLDDVLIQGNTFDLVEWQGIILKNHGYALGWPQHLCRDVVIDGNTFARIGHANFPEIGATGGGCGIFIQDCHTVIVSNNIDGGGITRAGLNWFHMWDSEAYLDPAYGVLNASGTIDYLAEMQVFYSGNNFTTVLDTPPGGGWKKSNGPALLPLVEPPTEVELLQARVAELEQQLSDVTTQRNSALAQMTGAIAERDQALSDLSAADAEVARLTTLVGQVRALVA